MRSKQETDILFWPPKARIALMLDLKNTKYLVGIQNKFTYVLRIPNSMELVESNSSFRMGRIVKKSNFQWGKL